MASKKRDSSSPATHGLARKTGLIMRVQQANGKGECDAKQSGGEGRCGGCGAAASSRQRRAANERWLGGEQRRGKQCRGDDYGRAYEGRRRGRSGHRAEIAPAHTRR